MRPLILITNDDGIDSPGLWAVVESLIDLGELIVVAPHIQQTGMGRSFPRASDTGIIECYERQVGDLKISAYGVHGSPAQAVAYGVLELSPRKPDLCISGINYGENLGLSLTCSGTLGAAFEADSHDIPSFAFSRQHAIHAQQSDDFEKLDWEAHRYFVRELVTEYLLSGFPEQVRIMNVNFPYDLSKHTKCRITRQSRLNYSSFLKPSFRNFDEPYVLKSEIDLKPNDVERDSDIYAVYYDRMISITPLTWQLSLDVKWFHL